MDQSIALIVGSCVVAAALNSVFRHFLDASKSLGSHNITGLFLLATTVTWCAQIFLALRLIAYGVTGRL